ncbi:37663_t:CDS:2, partial [Gigaspora margarita]
LSNIWIFAVPEPPLPTQVDPNTEAIRQLLEVMKHAKKTLAKKPGPEREKADKIRIDYFLYEVLKNIGDDSDPNRHRLGSAYEQELEKKLNFSIEYNSKINDLNERLQAENLEYLGREKEFQRISKKKISL